MLYTCCIFIKLYLISSVVGIINVNYMDKNETQRKLADIENNIDKKLNNLESHMLEKLLSYINGKVYATNKKIPEIEENITKIMNASNKKLEENLKEKITKSLNASLKNIEFNLREEISQAMIALKIKKEDTLKEDITEALNALNKKLEENLRKEISVALNASKKKIEENLREEISQAVNESNKKIEESFKDKIAQALNESNKSKEENLKEEITEVLKASNKKIEENLENKITQTSNKLDSMKKELFNEFQIHSPCKDEILNSNGITPFFFMDSEILNHATVKRNSAGHLTHFETHISIQADRYVFFRLSDVDSKSASNFLYFDIHIGGDDNQRTKLDIMSNGWKAAERVHTPDILSRTEFRAFYIKINDGNLEFGKESDSSPLLSYHDVRLRTVNYFQLHYGGTGRANLRFDCPAPVEELPYKEESFSDNYYYTPYYSIDKETLNHFTQKKNTTGHLTNFETHIAVQADKYVLFRLSDKDSDLDSNAIYYDIHIGGDDNQHMNVDINIMSSGWKTAQRIDTPNILSSTEFRAFYIRINDGNLEVGKEGDNSPLLSYHDARLRSVNYFRLYYGGGGKANIRYDCPAPVEELACKEETFSSRFCDTLYYSIDKETFHHITKKRNSTGHLTFFETHISIQAHNYVRFRLSDKDINSDSNVLYYDIHFGGENNQITVLDIMSNGWKNAQRVHTPNVLSSTEFRDFYIIINDGNLEVGKEGDSSPIFSHYDDHVTSVKYFQLYYGGGNEATIRYDCPAPIKVENNTPGDSNYDTSFTNTISIENQARPRTLETLPAASSETP